MKKQEFWVVGGDERQAILAGLLADDGHKVFTYGLEQRMYCEENLDGIGSANCVILPLPAMDGEGLLRMPLSKRSLTPGEVLDRLHPGQLVLAGRVSGRLRDEAAARRLEVRDYFAREELALLNAIPTAEGAIRLAMEALPITLHGARVLIVGFGRLGQALGPRLRGLGARVDVAARGSGQRSLAQVMGMEAQRLEGMTEWLHTYDLVINTAPALVLGVEELAALKAGAVVIDLASLPGGVDDETAAALGVEVIHALSLPGKEAPLSAARYLRDTVYHVLEGD